MSGIAAGSRLYSGRVMHRRLFPVNYHFDYRVFSLLADLDRIEDESRRLRWLSVDRFNLFSIDARDHGPRDGSPLRPWIDARLAEAGLPRPARVHLLCFPRVLGYGFNPLSVWYCSDADGQVFAVDCEVSNTFGEHHHYLLHDAGRPLGWPARAAAEKGFHVSPFIGMSASYHFRFGLPDERLDVVIREFQDERLMLAAVQAGRARALEDGQLLRLAAGYPLMTLKVMGLIHWQAFKIWRQGARFHRKPPPPTQEMTAWPQSARRP